MENNKKQDKFHDFVIHMPGFLEKIVAATLLIGVAYGCVQLIFAIARGLVVGHEEPAQALIRIVSIAILLLCRKYLFHEFNFKEE